MVKSCALPGCFVVTTVALLALLALMHVVFAMTGITGFAEFLLAKHSLVASRTLDLVVLAP